MAAPSNTDVINGYVVVSIVSGAEISPNTPNVYVGNVELVGEDVNKLNIGDQILFKNASFFSVGSDSWALTNQNDCFLIYTPAP